jgi:uncharacterized protein YpiB (UPF0302 family)
MEKHLLNSPQQPGEEMDSILAEQFLNNALLEFRKKTLKMQIDQSLSEKNKDEFMRLTEELNNLS